VVSEGAVGIDHERANVHPAQAHAEDPRTSALGSPRLPEEPQALAESARIRKPECHTGAREGPPDGQAADALDVVRTRRRIPGVYDGRQGTVTRGQPRSWRATAARPDLMSRLRLWPRGQFGT